MKILFAANIIIQLISFSACGQKKNSDMAIHQAENLSSPGGNENRNSPGGNENRNSPGGNENLSSRGGNENRNGREENENRTGPKRNPTSDDWPHQ